MVRLFSSLGYQRNLFSLGKAIPSRNCLKTRQFTPHHPFSTFSTPDSQHNLPSLPFIPLLISIEGNIGAGKTTLLKQLRANHPEWHSIDEPVETWSTIRNEEGKSILEVFYQDRKRWSYTFQNCALLTRYENIEKKVQEVKETSNHRGTHIFLTERCLDTDHRVFTRMLLEEGSISKMEIELYERLLRHLQLSATPLSAIIHVNTPPVLCKERIKIRGRSGEEAITQDYLDTLNKYQSKWIESTEIPVLSTVNTDFERVEQFISQLRLKAEADNALLSQSSSSSFTASAGSSSSSTSSSSASTFARQTNSSHSSSSSAFSLFAIHNQERKVKE